MSSSRPACPRSTLGYSSAALSAARFGALGLALLAGGCSASDTASPSWVAGPLQAFTNAEPPPLPKSPTGIRVEIEEDGLPSQLAPRHRASHPDDPSEPWSPNYGAPTAAVFDHRRLAQKLDAAEPVPAPAFHPPHARPLNADDVIRQAIANHEMRRPD